jgi:hypothetical protein
MVALPFAMLHVPPLTASVRVTEPPEITFVGPEIVPAFGNGSIVTVHVADEVPHAPLTE